MNIVSTLCRNRNDAEEAIAWLRERGYRDDEIGLAMYALPNLVAAGNKPEEQAMRHGMPLLGTATGISVAAAVAGVALAAGPLGILAAGPLAVLLTAMGAVSAGGIVGLLAGAGIPNHDAERYVDELKRGAVLVRVTPHGGDDEKVRAYFARFG